MLAYSRFWQTMFTISFEFLVIIYFFIKRFEGCSLKKGPTSEQFWSVTRCAWPKINWPIFFLSAPMASQYLFLLSKIFVYYLIFSYYLNRYISSKNVLKILPSPTTLNAMKFLQIFKVGCYRIFWIFYKQFTLNKQNALTIVYIMKD